MDDLPAELPSPRPIAALPLLSLPFLAGLVAPPAAAQDVTDRIQALASENAELYASPVTSGLGAGLASGFYRTADTHGILGFDVGIRVSGSLIPETREAQSFEPVLPSRLTFQGRTFDRPYGEPSDYGRTPTAAGEGTPVVLAPKGDFRAALREAGQDPDAFNVPFPEGFDLPAVPVVMGELNVGLAPGTEIMLRGFPEVSLGDDLGDVSAYGVGVKHRISDWLPGPIPVDLAVAGGYQRATLGDIVTAEARTAGAVVSKDLALITVFGGAGWEDSEVDVEYTFRNPEGNPGSPPDGARVAFTDEGENSSRLTAGLVLSLLPARLTVSYTEADYDVLQAAISLGTN